MKLLGIILLALGCTIYWSVAFDPLMAPAIICMVVGTTIIVNKRVQP